MDTVKGAALVIRMGSVRAMGVVAMDDNLVRDGLAGWRICRQRVEEGVWLGLNLRRVMERCGEMERQSGRAELKGRANQKSRVETQQPVPLQMKALNKPWPAAVTESKLAIALFAGLFLGAVVIFFSVPPPFPARGSINEAQVRRRGRRLVMHSHNEVIVRSLDMSSLHEAPRCTVCRSVPAVAFALGGLTFNYWHAFSDVLVELIVTGAQPWFIVKYRRVTALSLWCAACYPHLIVGLRGHRDFDIDPSRAPNGYDMVAFRKFVRGTVREFVRGTAMVFLRAGGVVVQVIPWGKMEPYAEGFFGAPAAHMGIRHVASSVAAEENTLYERYGKDHPVITDPDVFYRNGSNAKVNLFFNENTDWAPRASSTDTRRPPGSVPSPASCPHHRAKLALDGLGLVELIAP
ncbi:hypothetical protein HU200_017166 [Digitaria exilis]|uniref:Uncharacterized protein n=1 Tax=Digitaria exilis TaxID=1010633 RepID=A0A835F721_9POAL|nr:hypothetical protein HU200_017166 [Digitaria exilis]